jgi:hypothetical protein
MSSAYFLKLSSRTFHALYRVNLRCIRIFWYAFLHNNRNTLLPENTNLYFVISRCSVFVVFSFHSSFALFHTCISERDCTALQIRYSAMTFCFHWLHRQLPGILSYKSTVTKELFVRFEVLTAARTKMTVFWVVAPCSLVHGATTQKTAIFNSSLTNETYSGKKHI